VLENREFSYDFILPIYQNQTGKITLSANTLTYRNIEKSADYKEKMKLGPKTPFP